MTVVEITPHLGQSRRHPELRRSYRALLMFRAGKDTAFIADHFKVTEAGVLRWITQERSRERGLPNPYLAVE